MSLKKIYICSSLRIENHTRVTEILAQLPKVIHLRPYLEQTGNKLGHIEVDVAMINHSDEMWVVGEYGKDCSWELGYAAGIKKPVVIFRDERNSKSLDSDWMLYYGVNNDLVTIVDLEDAVREESKRRELAKKEVA